MAQPHREMGYSSGSTQLCRGMGVWPSFDLALWGEGCGPFPAHSAEFRFLVVGSSNSTVAAPLLPSSLTHGETH